MHTTTDQINERIYRISTSIPEIAPAGFTFNQFLVDAEEPLGQSWSGRWDYHAIGPFYPGTLGTLAAEAGPWLMYTVMPAPPTKHVA
jgi:hypothetical protein